MAIVNIACVITVTLVLAMSATVCRSCDAEGGWWKSRCGPFGKKDPRIFFKKNDRAGQAENAVFSEYLSDCKCLLHFSRQAGDLLLHPTSDQISQESLDEMRRASRVCLPCPGRNLEAYSGFIPVDDGHDNTYSSYLFFLHIKSEKNSDKKPLLLWLEGAVGKSALYGQFLENGPLGMTVLGTLYKRRHTLLKQFNIIYLDQPVGAGYSFDKYKKYPSSLDEVSVHLLRFIRRFLRIFHEYNGRDFYVAGESYGARSAVGMASRVLARTPEEIPLRFRGAMLGVPFVFPLLNILNSADFLYCTGLLDDTGRELYSGMFSMIQKLVSMKQYLNAAELLSQTILNLGFHGKQTLFSNLTGFHSYDSIVSPQERREVVAYHVYANRWDFKQRIHVNISRTLDGTRLELAKVLALNDFFTDQREKLAEVLNKTHILLYVAQLDAFFPAVKIYKSLKVLQWRASELFNRAERTPWYKNNQPSMGLLGYLEMAGTLMYATVLFGGHRISLDCTAAVSELYGHFVKFVEFTNKSPPISQQKVSSQ